MASSSDRKLPSKIVSTIKSISSKDQSSSAVAVSRLSSEEQNSLLEKLRKIECESFKKDKKEEKSKESDSKSIRESRFIGRLIEKMRGVTNEVTTIRTRFYNAKEVCTSIIGDDKTRMIQRFNQLEGFIADLEVLGCIARKKQAEVIPALQEKLGLSIEGVARKLDIDVKFAQRLFTFYKLTTKYPSLVISGYCFETLLTFKKAIEQRASEDENFACRLELDIVLHFEGEDDSMLDEEENDTIEAATSEMGSASIDE